MWQVSLELGGKAPVLVMADADLDLAADRVHASRVIFTGQVAEIHRTPRRDAGDE